jgi:hypothetical protein
MERTTPVYVPISGPVPIDSPLYVKRDLDDRVIAAINRGDYVDLYGGRQTGKTSLVLRLRRSLGEQGAVSAYVDMSLFAETGVDRANWFKTLHDSMLLSMLPVDTRSSLPDAPIYIFGFPHYIYEAVRGLSPRRPLTIFFDEVTAVPETIRQPLFANIRGMFNQRTEIAGCSKSRDVVFVFVGTFDPGTLILGDNSPFNVAISFLTMDWDLTQEQVESHLIQAGLPQVEPQLNNGPMGILT